MIIAVSQRVDFYVLENSDESSLLYCACRIAEKAYQQGFSVYIQVDEEPVAFELDALLWTFNPISFIPHEALVAPGASTLPVVISTMPAEERWDNVLVTLTQSVPENIGRFSRIADVILNTERHKRYGRERFRTYKKQGIEPNTHNVNISSKY